MSYDLRVNILRVAFIARVTSYFYYASYKLLFIARVTYYFLHAKYCLLHTSQFLTMSYSKDKNDKVVYDVKVMIKDYSSG